MIIIIGAGIGGLSAAIRLAVAGRSVLVLEAGSAPGGKLSQVRLQGAGGTYRFDGGPSLFTMPEYHAELFTQAGERQADHFSYLALDEVCRYFYPDGSEVTGYADADAFAQALQNAFGEDPAVVKTYLARAAEKFAIAGDIFLNRPLHLISSYLDATVARALTRMHRLQIFSSLHGLNARTFTDPRTVQLFDRYATYNGSTPYRASALYSMIPSFEYGQGAYLPTEGMASIATSLEALAKRLGVAFRYNTPATAIGLDAQNRIAYVDTPDERLETDTVVSNTDVRMLYRNLLPKNAPQPGQGLSSRLARLNPLKQELSTSAIVFYWGLRGSFAQLGLHNIFFSADYKAEFAELFGTNKHPKSLPADPTIYLNITSKHIPTDAPPGCENWFVMVNAPARPELATPEAISALRARILIRLSTALGQDIAPLIEAEDILTPALLQSRTGAWGGALYGPASNTLRSGFARHPGEATHIPGLYLASGTVHPGGGIPLALKSGQIAAGLILNK